MSINNLPAKSKINAIKCGFYENTYGNFFLFSSEPELGKATFKGKDLNGLDIQYDLNIDITKSKLIKFGIMMFHKINKFFS